MKPEQPAIRNPAEEEIRLHHWMAGEYERRRSGAGSKYFEDYWNEEALRALAPSGTGDVLDCCCGDGILLPVLADHYKNVVGIDISEDMLALARRRPGVERCTILHGNIEALPLENSSFDAAIFRGSFHHLAQPLESLRDVNRVLRPGGRVVFLEPNGNPWLLRIFRKVYCALSPRFTAAHKSFRRAELFGLIGAAGLEPLSAYTIFFFSYPFAGLLDHFPVFRYVPFHAALTRLLIRVDRGLARVPLIRRWGLCMVVAARKPPEGRAA